MAMADMASRRQGDRYVVTPEEIAKYKDDGYVHLKVILHCCYQSTNSLSSLRLCLLVNLLVPTRVAAFPSMFGHPVSWFDISRITFLGM